MQEPIKYKSYTITYDPPPISLRGHDYQFSHDDYDGAPDGGDVRCGSAGSIMNCIECIDDIEEGLETPEMPIFEGTRNALNALSIKG